MPPRRSVLPSRRCPHEGGAHGDLRDPAPERLEDGRRTSRRRQRGRPPRASGRPTTSAGSAATSSTSATAASARSASTRPRARRRSAATPARPPAVDEIIKVADTVIVRPDPVPDGLRREDERMVTFSLFSRIAPVVAAIAWRSALSAAGQAARATPAAAISAGYLPSADRRLGGDAPPAEGYPQTFCSGGRRRHPDASEPRVNEGDGKLTGISGVEPAIIAHGQDASPRTGRKPEVGRCRSIWANACHLRPGPTRPSHRPIGPRRAPDKGGRCPAPLRQLVV